MTPEENFISLLKQNISSDDVQSVVQAKVIEVAEMTCKVRLWNGNELDNVRFRATEEAEKGFAFIPKQDTNCLIGFVGDDINRPYLITADEIDAIRFQVGEEKLVIDSDGFDVDLDAGKLNASNSQASLREVLEDVIAMIEQLTVSTATGPSGTPLPPTIASASQLKTKISNLFK